MARLCSRSRPTRRRWSTRPRPTGRSRRSSCSRGRRRALVSQSLLSQAATARRAKPTELRASVSAPAPVQVSVSGRAAGRQAPVTNGSAAEARANATPVARRTALELGLSLHGLAGTRPGGRITADDVRRAASSPGTTSVPSAMSRTRRGDRHRADADAGDDRQANGPRGRDRPGLHSLDGRRRLADRRAATDRTPRGRRPGALAQRLRRQGRCSRAARLPAVQRVLGG